MQWKLITLGTPAAGERLVIRIGHGQDRGISHRLKLVYFLYRGSAFFLKYIGNYILIR